MFMLTCPACQKVLRTALPIQAGRRVKCPSCAKSFTAPSTPISSQDDAPGHFAAGPAPRSTSGVAITAQTPVSSRTEYGPDSFESDPLLGRSIRKPKSSHWGSLLLLTFLMCVLVVGGVVAFALRTPKAEVAAEPDAAVVESPLAFVPSNAQIVAGVDANQIRESSPQWRQELQVLEGRTGLAIPPELAEQLKSLLVGVVVDANKAQPDIVMALTFSRPYDREQLKKSLAVTESETIAGKEILRAQRGRDKMSVALLSDTLVIAGTAEPRPFHAHVYVEKRKPLPPEMAAEVERVHAKGLWVVANIAGMLQDAPPVANVGPFGLDGSAEMFAILKKAKASSLTVDSPPGAARSFAATVLCADDADAGSLSRALNVNWQKWRPLLGFFGGGALGAPGQAGLGAALKDLTDTLTIDANGPRMAAHFSLSQAALKGLDQAGPALPFAPRPAFNR